MTDIIQLLPDHVANQIAAGEVVQRPASVVKELLENAIDAGASKIELIIQNAGKNLIQVIDNGIGMSETDARMAFERHATSKIRKTDDIFNIKTKGFRGEALASISAIAQVELKTKPENADIGTTVYIEGGELQFQEPIQVSKGSVFSVKNIFYNVPARRKFLKKENIEFRHIIDEFQRVALAHEQIEFNLYHNDENIFRLRKSNPSQRIIDIFGRKLQPLLIPIKEDLDWIKLEGYVGKPESAKKTRGEQFFFVNHRYFRSPYLNRAVQNAFEGLIQNGYTPSFFLYLQLNPDKIDINIHPQKTEVKFENEQVIYALIRSAIKKSLGIYNISPSLDFERSTNADSFFTGNKNINSPSFKAAKIAVNRDFNPFKDPKITSSKMVNISELMNSSRQAEPSKINELFGNEDCTEDIMRLPNGYWIYNQGEKTLMLDLGRINRLVVMNQQKDTFFPKKVQSLLFSLEYPLSEIEKTKYKSIKNHLPSLGFDIELSDDNILKINGIPENMDQKKVNIFLEKLFEILEYNPEEDFIKHYKEQWIKIHTKSKFEYLFKPDVVELLKSFSELGFPQYLPNGKKCFIEIPLNELKNKF